MSIQSEYEKLRQELHDLSELESKITDLESEIERLKAGVLAVAQLFVGREEKFLEVLQEKHDGLMRQALIYRKAEDPVLRSHAREMYRLASCLKALKQSLS